MSNHWKHAAALVTVLAACAALLASTPAEATPTELPVPGFGAIAVDPETARMYVSSPTADSVTVLNPNAHPMRTITGIDGAGEMVVDGGRLYVVAGDAGRVEAYDTQTFRRVAVYGDGILDAPGPLVKVGNRLWTSSGACHQWETKLASIDIATGVTVVHPWVNTVQPSTVVLSFEYCVGLAADPALGEQLLAFTNELSPASLGRVDVSLGIPVITHLVRTGSSSIDDVAVLPGGEQFVVAAGAPYWIQQYRVSDLRESGEYRTGHYPNAVAVSPAEGGLLAAGRSAYYDPDVDLFDLDDPHPTPARWTADLGATTRLLDRGLAFSADGRRVYAVFTSAASANPLVAQLEVATGVLR